MILGLVSIPVNFPRTRFYNAKRSRSAIVRQLVAIVRQRKQDLDNGTASASQDLLSHLLTSVDYYTNDNKFGTELVIVNIHCVAHQLPLVLVASSKKNAHVRSF